MSTEYRWDQSGDLFLFRSTTIYLFSAENFLTSVKCLSGIVILCYSTMSVRESFHQLLPLKVYVCCITYSTYNMHMTHTMATRVPQTVREREIDNPNICKQTYIHRHTHARASVSSDSYALKLALNSICIIIEYKHNEFERV